MDKVKPNNDIPVMGDIVSLEKKADLLYDHYKDTCGILKESLKQRERLFLLALVLISLHFLQITDPDGSSNALISLIDTKAGLQLKASIHAISALLWVMLLVTSIKYFQINVFVNRTYDYLHAKESDLKEILSAEIINREGAAYLNEYPKFSDFTHFIYTWLFPAGLLLIVSYKIILEWPTLEGLGVNYIISIMSFLFIALGTILYLIFLHRKQPTKNME